MIRDRVSGPDWPGHGVSFTSDASRKAAQTRSFSPPASSTILDSVVGLQTRLGLLTQAGARRQQHRQSQGVGVVIVAAAGMIDGDAVTTSAPPKPSINSARHRTRWSSPPAPSTILGWLVETRSPAVIDSGRPTATRFDRRPGRACG